MSINGNRQSCSILNHWVEKDDWSIYMPDIITLYISPNFRDEAKVHYPVNFGVSGKSKKI